MRSGQMDRRITIERPTVVDDPEYGPQPGPWEVFGTPRMPASRQDDLPSNTESNTNGLRMSDSPARLRIRYMRGITSDMRIVMHDEVDRLYQISSTPAEIGRRQWLEFTIREYSSK
jgi:head-tail adaptor